MKKSLNLIFLFSIFLIACLTYKYAIKEESKKEKVEEHIVITEDNMVSFRIINQIGVSSENVENVKREVLEAYNVINKSIQIDYVPSEMINIFLYEGDKATLGYRNSVQLFSVKENKFSLVHELTHTLLGYGGDFDTSNGYLTQEGFAIYMESEYGKPSYPNFGIHLHKIMKYIIDSEKNIPLYKLIDGQYDGSLFHPFLIKQEDHTLQWISYIQSGSFITYLIDSYGLERFELIYNSSNLAKKIEGNYGKTIDELEKDWLIYVVEHQKNLTNDDKQSIENFYKIAASLNQINQQVFIRN